MHTKEEVLFRAILIASLIIGVILLYFFYIQVRQKRRYMLLNTRKISDEIDTLEKERKRIAEDLHDDLGPVLSATKSMLESVNSGSEVDQLRVTQAVSLLEDMIFRLRRISGDLLPPTLVDQGLAAAINGFVEMVSVSSALTISWSCIPKPPVTDRRAMHIFRIIQEIIHNAIKHARAQNLYLTVSISGAMLQILATDDGSGFVYRADTKMKGQGLRNIQNRVLMLNGDIGIRTAPSMGTSYNIRVPLTAD